MKTYLNDIGAATFWNYMKDKRLLAIKKSKKGCIMVIFREGYIKNWEASIICLHPKKRKVTYDTYHKRTVKLSSGKFLVESLGNYTSGELYFDKNEWNEIMEKVKDNRLGVKIKEL